MEPKYVGEIFDNRYLIKNEIGMGGMSLVFLAYDNAMKRDVAVKVLKEELINDADAVERFMNEAKAVTMLTHENIVKCFDYSNGTKLKYIVMQYVDGETLKSFIERKKRLSCEETIDISIKILSALEHAHEKNIIHRDIKPQNILLSKDGGLKVTDFGIAKIPTNDPLSVSCMTVGTVDYISPEQASGKTIDRRTDIYSLGIMMYEMITGKVPFSASTPTGIAYMQINEKPVPPSTLTPDIPVGLEQVILKAINKNPDDRFDNARQMLDCLLRLRENICAKFDFMPVSNTVKAVSASPEKDVLFSGSESAAPASAENTDVYEGGKSKGRKKKTKKRVITEISVETKKTHVSLASVVLGAICALGIVGLTAFLFVYEIYFAPIINSDNYEVIVVDDFEGQIYNNELQKNLEKAGYMVSIEWVSDADHIYGTILSQSPRKNSRRKIVRGDTYCELKLKVCMGENMTLLDNYVGLEYRYADILLSQKKIKANFVKVFSETMPQGRIVSTYPEGGTRISDDTTVTVYVSKGPDIEYTIVPNLVGKTVSEVADELRRAKLNAGKITYEYSDVYPSGTVIRQGIFRGEAVPTTLTAIDLVISLGPEHPVTTEPPVTVEPPTTPEPPVTTPPTTGEPEPPSTADPVTEPQTSVN